MWTVYMLECKNGAFYTGVTTDPERRFKEHQEKSARYTSYNPPVRMVYKERFISKVKAFRREAAIKKLTRRKKETLIGYNT